MDDEKVGEKDAAISMWMLRHHWPVTERHYDPRLSWYLWRSYVQPTISLWLTRNFFDDHSALEIVRVLDNLRADDYLRRYPEVITVIRNSDAGEPELAQLTEKPKDVIRANQRFSARSSE